MYRHNIPVMKTAGDRIYLVIEDPHTTCFDGSALSFFQRYDCMVLHLSFLFSADLFIQDFCLFAQILYDLACYDQPCYRWYKRCTARNISSFRTFVGRSRWTYAVIFTAT